ncbi:pantetheine-phosphate adenylyltransferase [Candidatus Ruminimicrobium bovinum]|uniref:pantetheine-phosphate adenylyltransferase n=1 Tax=Candidatus Ruminimicrobium bovinum TaxID=3242779 RepID=UPI0039B85121
MKNEIIAVYPGSFDPLTKGHLDIIEKASKIFPVVVVAVANNYSKQNTFSVTERLGMMKESIKIKNVKIDSFSGLLVDYLDNIGSFVVIRGLRALSDFEYEFQMALMNRTLNNKIETIFLMPDHKYTFLSSSMVREIASLGGNFKNFVPPAVYKTMKKKFK